MGGGGGGEGGRRTSSSPSPSRSAGGLIGWRTITTLSVKVEGFSEEARRTSALALT